MQQKLGQIFFTARSWSFRKQHRKGTTRSMPKIKIYVYYIFTENICPTRNATQVVVFLPECINFVEERLKFSHFEGNITP